MYTLLELGYELLHESSLYTFLTYKMRNEPVTLTFLCSFLYYTPAHSYMYTCK